MAEEIPTYAEDSFAKLIEAKATKITMMVSLPQMHIIRMAESNDKLTPEDQAKVINNFKKIEKYAEEIQVIMRKY